MDRYVDIKCNSNIITSSLLESGVGRSLLGVPPPLPPPPLHQGEVRPRLAVAAVVPPPPPPAVGA